MLKQNLRLKSLYSTYLQLVGSPEIIKIKDKVGIQNKSIQYIKL